MVDVEQWAELRRLHFVKGVSIRELQLGDVVVGHRLATFEAELAELLEHPQTRQLGLIAQQPLDLGSNGSSFDGAGLRS